MKKTTGDTASSDLEQPTTGGSFARQDDGSLKMIEGAAPADAPLVVPEPAPAADGAAATGDADTTTKQNEG